MEMDNISCCVDVNISKHHTRKCKNHPRHFHAERKQWYCSLHLPVGEECPICFEDIHRNNIVTLDCDHTFHRSCLRKWLTSDNARNCPNCRGIVADSIFKRLRVPARCAPSSPRSTPTVSQAHILWTYQFGDVSVAHTENDDLDTDTDDTEGEEGEVTQQQTGFFTEVSRALEDVLLVWPDTWPDVAPDDQVQPAWVVDGVRRVMDLFHGFFR